LREEVEKKHPGFSLKPILTWKTRITHLKTIPAGQPVGYDCTVTTTRETRIAFIPIGYFDGFDFRLSNTGHAHINGIPVPILGRVSMNVATLDVTDHPNIATGDEAIILGPYDKVSAYDWVQNTGNPNIRELITTIHPSIERIIVENQLDNVEISGILAQKSLEQKTDILA
jgi:alanine racemase